MKLLFALLTMLLFISVDPAVGQTNITGIRFGSTGDPLNGLTIAWNGKGIADKIFWDTPLIIVNGDTAVAGKETTALVEFLDFYPTLAYYFKLEGIPEYLEGKSFEKIIQDPDASFRYHDNIVTLRDGFIGRSVKTREWRYTEWDDGNRGTELYDQLNDPLEYNNLSGLDGYDSIQEQMKKLIIKP